MIDAILTGFFTGIGVITASWFYDKYIKNRLDKTHEKIEEGINLLKGGQK